MCFGLHVFEWRAVVAFRREGASRNRGPTFKQPRGKFKLRDQRRTHCLTCLAVFEARAAEGSPSRAVPRGSPILAPQLLVWELCLFVML